MIQDSTNTYCTFFSISTVSHHNKVIHVLSITAWKQMTDGPVDTKYCLNMEKDSRLDRLTDRQTHTGVIRDRRENRSTV